MDDNDIQSFLKFHKSMGDFVYFPEPQLQNILIIDPQWLVDAFKALITAHEFLDHRQLNANMLKHLKIGTVSSTALEILWHGNDVESLKALMIKFHLMLPLVQSNSNDQTFLIPCMLPKTRFDVYKQEPFTNMEVVYLSIHEGSPSIPIRIFHKLISKCGNDTDWKLSEVDHISYTDVSFGVCRGIRLALTLHKQKVKIGIWCHKELDLAKLRYILPALRRMMSVHLSHFHIAESSSVIFTCPYSKPGETCRINMVPSTDPHQLTYVPEKNKCDLHNQGLSVEDIAWLKHVSTEYNIQLTQLCEGTISNINSK